jgi:hypothetical protein
MSPTDHLHARRHNLTQPGFSQSFSLCSAAVYRNGVQIFGGTPEGETCVRNSIANLNCSAGTVVLLRIAGCGGGGSGNTMSLSVGDAPLDGAEKVVVLFGIRRSRERLSCA